MQISKQFKLMVWTIIAGILWLHTPLTNAQEMFGDSRDKVIVTITPAYTTVPQGSDLPIAVVFDMEFGWHIYASDAKIPEEYFLTVIEAKVENDAAAIVHTGFLQWPKKHEIEFYGDMFDVYEGKAIAFLPVTIPADAPLGKTKIKVKAAFQSCDDVNCLPPTPYPPEPGKEVSQDWQNYGYEIEIEIVPVGSPSSGKADDKLFAGKFDGSVFSKIRAGEKPPDIIKFDAFGLAFSIDVRGYGFILLMFVAALGGFLLNLTPCVLPVIPLKIMSMAKTSGNRAKTLSLGIAMCLGIIAFWMSLGTAIAFFHIFTSTNELFKHSAFSISVGIIIAAMAIGMCGLFTLRLPSFVYRINPSHDSHHGSFGFGIMTAVLSTPCTAPFMGAALAWAVTQTSGVVLLVFCMVGSGMAFPYLVLAAFPNLAAKMPRTGPASELLKQVMGLFMLAAAAYFIGVGVSGSLRTAPDPVSRMYLWVVAACVGFAGIWLILRSIKISKTALSKVILSGLGIITIAISISGGLILTARSPINWVYFTPERLDEALADGNIVVVEFTAEWCINCKALEKTVLSSEHVVALLNGSGVVPIKVDLTGNDEMGYKMLNDVNGIGIPLLIIFEPNGDIVFRGDFYTVEQVLNAINSVSSAQANSSS